MHNFATPENPLRASSVPKLLQCSLRGYLLSLGILVDGSSEAADTGSLFHEAVKWFYTLRGLISYKKAWKKAYDLRHMFPLAKIEKAESMFKRYTDDPRNQVKPVLVEKELTVTLDPWETDTTGQAIHIVGHLDQVREIDGTLYVVDMKCTSRGGTDALAEYTAQLVLYALGASKLLKRPVEPGYILRATSYLTQKNEGVASPDDVMFKCLFSMSDCTRLLNEIRKEVARVRAGEVGPRPSSGCVYCPAGHIGYCSSLLDTLEVQNATPKATPRKKLSRARA